MCEKAQDSQKIASKPSQPETSSVKKRRRRSKKAQVKPRKLFHEEEEEEREDPEQDVDAAAAEQEKESDAEAPSSEKEGSEETKGDFTDSQEDDDIFAGKFAYATPEKKKKKKELLQLENVPSNAPSAESKGSSLMDVSPGEAKAMRQANELMKKVDKKILDCLPEKVNPFSECIYHLFAFF